MIRHRAVFAIAMGVVSVAGACADGGHPLSELPPPPHRFGAVLLVHARDCDSNLQLFDIFARNDVGARMPLLGVVALDTSDIALIRPALSAFDVDAPLLEVSERSRDSLRALTHDMGMSLVLYDGRRNPIAVMPPPRSPNERRQFIREVVALASRSSDTIPNQ